MNGHGQASYQVGGSDVTWREIGDEIVLLDLARSLYFGLNATAVTLWRRLANGATVGELAAALTADTGISMERAATDVADFLDALRLQGLLPRS
ncbi:MAG: PqqD family protein [Frankia sp.]